MAVNQDTIQLWFSNAVGQTNNSANTIVNWENYELTSAWLTPCDTFSFRVGDDTITPEIRELMQGGTTVSFRIDIGDGNPRLFTVGKIDEVNLSIDRHGTYWNIHGRSIIAEACETGIDPWSNSLQIVEGMTMGNLMANVFAPLGMNIIYTDDSKNREVQTGNNALTTKYITINVATTNVVEEGNTGNLVEESGTTNVQIAVDPTNTFGVEKLTLKQTKPEHGETAYSFAEKMARRFGAHIWGSVVDSSVNDQTYSVNIGRPNFSQPPLYAFRQSLTGEGNNVIRSTLSIQYKDQPAVIIGRGLTDSGDLATSTLRCAKVSEFYGRNADGSTTDAVNRVLNQYKNGQKMVLPFNIDLASYQKYFVPPTQIRALYFYDHRAATVGELEASVCREMSKHMMNALKITYLVDGHSQIAINGQNTVYTHNCIAYVYDEVLGLDDNFWIESVRFTQSREEGSHTEITLIIPYSIQLSPETA